MKALGTSEDAPIKSLSVRSTFSIVFLAVAAVLFGLVLSAPIQLSVNSSQNPIIIEGLIVLFHLFLLALFMGLAIKNCHRWLKATGIVLLAGVLILLLLRLASLVRQAPDLVSIKNASALLFNQQTVVVLVAAALSGIILMWLDKTMRSRHHSKVQEFALYPYGHTQSDGFTLRRIVAALLDYGAFATFVWISTFLFGSRAASGASSEVLTATLSIGGAPLPGMHTSSILVLVYLWVWVLYFPIAEAITGRTLGKFLLGLVVVRESAQVPSLQAGIVRHLFDPVDFFLLGLVGLLVSSQTKGHRRIGDLVAKSQVISR